MAVNFLNHLNEDRQSVPGMGVAALGMLPVLGAVGMGYRKLQSNTPVSASQILASQTNLASLGKDVARGLNTSANLERITEKFMESDAFDEMMKKTQERNAVIQSLLSTVDDPAAGFDSNKVMSIKDDLIRISNQSTDSEEARKIMKAAITTINESGSETVHGRLASRFREFSRVGAELVPPQIEFKSGATFQVIEHGNARNMDPGLRKKLFAGNDAGFRAFNQAYGEIMEAVGPSGQQFVDFVHAPSGMGQEAIHARFFSRGQGGERKYEFSFPVVANSRAQRGATLFPMGESMNTRYFGPSAVIEATDAEALQQKVFAREGKPGKVTIGEARKAGMVRSWESKIVERFKRDVRSGPNGVTLRNKNKFNRFARLPLTVASRVVSTSGVLDRPEHLAHRQHIMNQATFQHTTIMFNNLQYLDEPRKNALITGWVGDRLNKDAADGGVGAPRLVSDYVDGLQHGMLQMRNQSALSSYRNGAGGSNRSSMPIIARLEQIAGRDARWVGGNGGRMGRHGTFGYGAGAAPIEWGPNMTGMTNKALLLDMTMGHGTGAFARTEGYGQGYTVGGLGTLQNDSTIPLLDPDTHKNMSTRLQERLHARYKAGEGMEYYKVTSDGKLFHEASNSFFDTYLGQGPAGSQFINVDPRAQGMWLGVTEANPVHGKNQLQVQVHLEREMDRAKVFGDKVKGTVLGVEAPVFLRDISTYDATKGWLDGLNIPLNQVIAASGEMVKKAPDILNTQMISGLGLVSKFDAKLDPFSYIEGKVKARKKPVSFGGGSTGKVAYEVIERLAADLRDTKATGVKAEDVGRVLAGLYYGSGLARHDATKIHGEEIAKKATPEAFYKKKAFAFKAEALDSHMAAMFGTQYGEIKGFMQKGLGLAAGGFSAGTGHGDFKLGRGSVEPRFMEMMSTRLKDMGMSNGEISEFMIGIFKRKIGGREGMAVVRPLEQMVASHLSMTKPGGDVPVLKLADFQKIMTETQDGSFSSYLKTQKGGVFLDLGDANTRGGEVIGEAAREKFGNQKQIFFAGGDAISQMHGAEIKQVGQTLQVGSKYEKTVDSFAHKLVAMSSSKEEAVKEAAESMQVFKKDIAVLWAHAFHRQSGGKIRGSTMNMMQGYASGGVGQMVTDVFTGKQVKSVSAGLTEAAAAAVQGLMKHSHGQAAFLDSAGFLSMLNDYMGNDKGELLKMFYTGSEAAWKEAQQHGVQGVNAHAGIFTATQRNPILGYGNSVVSQIYRDVREVGKGQSDDIFSFVKGRHAAAFNELEKHVGKVGGWGDIAAHSKGEHGTAVKRFFNEMAGGLKNWVKSGGGSINFADDRFTITAGKTSIKNVDFGFAGAAIGDFDGDWGNTILLDKDTRKLLRSTLGDAAKREKYLAANAAAIAQGAAYTEYAKQGLKANVGDELADEFLEEVRTHQQDILKEKGAARSTGPVDIALNKLKRAALNSKNDANSAVTNEAIQLLQILQEHTTIKGKKLEKFVPLGDMLTSAIEEGFSGKGITPLKELFENVLFPRASMPELWDGVDLQVSTASGGALPGYVKGGNGARVNLTGVLARIADSMANYSEIGGGIGETANILASRVSEGALDMQSHAFQNIGLAGTSGVQAGMASANRPAMEQAMHAVEGGWNRLTSAAGKVDARMAGMVTLGLGAGAAILGMAGVDGYDSKPLMMAGDMPSAYVQKGVGSFNLLDQSSAGAASGGPMGDPYDMINTPMNMGTTYVGRNNGYNIRGESGNMNGVDKVSGYLNTLTRGMGRGSIMINDARRPITSSYTDKLLGEY